jgi:hypothetical protein
MSIPRDIVNELLDPDIRENNYPPIMLIRVVMLKYLRKSFYGRAPGDYKWSDTEELTEIIIKDYISEEDLSIATRPIVAVGRGPAVPMELGMNNSMISYDMSTDSSEHLDLTSIPLQFIAVGNNLMESEYIASIVYGMLRYFKPLIRQLGIADIRGFRIDPTQPSTNFAQEGKVEAYKTIVHCNSKLYDGWRMRWKTDREMGDHAVRTGVDRRSNKIPPVTLDGYTINADTDND